MKLTREDKPDETVGTFTVPVKDAAFVFEVPLPDETGVYRITLNSLVTFPRGTFDTPGQMVCPKAGSAITV